MPIQYHVSRAFAERRVATEARGVSQADIHVALAEMHEQAAASAVNKSLAPLEYSQAWSKFAC